MAERFLVNMFGRSYLSTDEVWPNGDAPERPTAEDVAAVMREAGRWEVLNDWLVAEDLRVEIHAGSTFSVAFENEGRESDSVAS